MGISGILFWSIFKLPSDFVSFYWELYIFDDFLAMQQNLFEAVFQKVSASKKYSKLEVFS